MSKLVEVRGELAIQELEFVGGNLIADIASTNPCDLGKYTSSCGKRI